MLGAFIKPLRRFFPSVVTGTVVLSIGLSLISVGINSFGGGNGAKDFGSLENLFLAFVVLIVILFVKHWTKGYLSSSSILIGIIVGYIVAAIMGCVLPHTAVNAEELNILSHGYLTGIRLQKLSGLRFLSSCQLSQCLT